MTADSEDFKMLQEDLGLNHLGESSNERIGHWKYGQIDMMKRLKVAVIHSRFESPAVV